MADSSNLSRPRINAQDVKGTLNFRQEDRYPDRVGLHPFGTIEKGFAWFSQEKLLPENTDSSSREHLLMLENLYAKVIPLSHRLHGTPAEKGSLRSRRNLSKSDETQNQPSEPNRTLTSLLSQINLCIVLFDYHKIAKKLEREKENLNIDLLKAIEIANQGLLVFSLGDYYAALCKDFKDAKEFTKPGERQKWKFLGYTQFSEIVAKYDAEQAKPASGMPITESLKLALKYTGKRYKSVDQIVGFMRSYGDRNMQVHPVKKFFEEGAADELRKAILRDYNSIPFFGTGPEIDAKKMIVMEVLEQVVERFFAAWTWEDPGHWRPAATMLEMQARHEEKMKGKGKILIFNNDPFDTEDINDEKSESKPKRDESNIKKGDRTRDKSLAEEELKDAIRTIESEYKDAIAQCAGQVADISANHFVEAVLKSTKEEAKEAIAKSRIDAKAKKKLEKAKKEISDLEAENDEKDAKIADLEAENGGKDAKIAELEALLEAMNSV